jgi:hypothetical protein
VPEPDAPDEQPAPGPIETPSPIPELPPIEEPQPVPVNPVAEAKLTKIKPEQSVRNQLSTEPAVAA